MKLASAKLYQLTLLCSALLCIVPSAAFAADPASDSSEASNEGESEGSKESSKGDDDAATDGEGASEKTDGKDGEDEEEKKNVISIYGEVALVADQGSFTKTGQNNTASNPNTKSKFYDFQGLALEPYLQVSYSRASNALSLGLGGTQYLIGGSNTNYEFLLGDLSLQYTPPSYTFESLNTSVGGWVTLGFPTSKRSQFARLIMGTTAYAWAAVNILDSLSLNLRLSGSKSFHKFKGQVAEAKFDDEKLPSIVARPEEYINGNLIFIGGNLTEWRLGVRLGLSWSIWYLRFGLAYSFSQGWSYKDSKIKAADCSSFPFDETGRRVSKCSDRSIGQSISGTLSISYSLGQHVEALKGFGLYLAARNFQSPKTGDNKSFNFPFWNFSGAAGNYSSLTLGITYGYDWGF